MIAELDSVSEAYRVHRDTWCLVHPHRQGYRRQMANTHSARASAYSTENKEIHHLFSSSICDEYIVALTARQIRRKRAVSLLPSRENDQCFLSLSLPNLEQRVSLCESPINLWLCIVPLRYVESCRASGTSLVNYLSLFCLSSMLVNLLRQSFSTSSLQFPWSTRILTL